MTTFRRAGAATVALALASFAGPGCSKSAAPLAPPVAHAVTIRKIAFDPPVTLAAPGDTLVWTNRDLVPHTVNARDGSFQSGNLLPDSTWRWVVAGHDSAAYFCTYHTTMRGVVRIHVRG